MSIANVRFEIARHFREELGDAFVSEHGGAFSLEDIKRIALKSPAIVVGALGIPSFEIQGSVISATTVFAAFCLAYDRKKERRDIAALLLAESVAVETLRNNWDGSASSSPKNIVGTNLYSIALDKLGVAMWAIRWEQLVDLQRNVLATLDDFLTMHSTYDLGQTDDTEVSTDVTELPQ